ncbi:MAG: superoxide dismutase [Gemmataceae bacterium]|nr:superoxide dismutase [Gemmataceae bacterium]
MMNRREVLAAAAAAVLLPRLHAADGGFTLPPLPYAADALEPYIDAKTMEIHHGRHHKAYVDNLNKALAGTAWLNKPVEDVLKAIKELPEDKQQAVINNAGGHYNHTMFWTTMAKNGGKPSDDFLKAWGADLPSLQKAVKEAGLTQFGSGWAWVVWSPAEKKMMVINSKNQDCPLMSGLFPLLGCDVWEHAYYLKYQNKRADYIDAWWNVVNWDAVQARLKIAQKI